MAPFLPDWVMKLSLGDAGSIASIIGVLLTIWVALAVRRIRSFYLFTARVPGLSRRLKQHASSLATYMNDPKSFADPIREEMVAAEVTVHSLERKLSGHVKKTAKDLLLNIRRANGTELDASVVRGVYLLMIRVNEQLKDIQSDLKWEK
jgi:hypothetical protein